MGNTYTGVIDPTISLTLQSDQIYPDNNNRQGTLVEVSSLGGATVDNIFYFNSVNAGKYYRRVIDGPMRAAQCGIYPGGADQTSKLNTALGIVTEIVFDYSTPATITISGTVTVPAGKVLTFRPGNMLTGSGTINGGIIDAPNNTQIFDTTLTINPEGITGDKFSVKWFGAKGNDLADDQPAIQKTIDTIIANNSKLNTAYFPNGVYRCFYPIILENFVTPVDPEERPFYTFHTVFLEGESSWWPFEGTGSVIRFLSIGEVDNKQRFGIGIQLGKGTKILNLKLIGEFAPPAATGYNWYKLTFEEFTDPNCRDLPDAPYSPYAGIVIDPFSKNGSLPPDGGYEGLSSYYTKDEVHDDGGSTGIEFEDIFVTNFTVGFICSPNGYTRNADQIIWKKIQFANVKAAFVNCTDQEKVNVIDIVGCWADVHTVFTAGSYFGPQTPGVYKVSNVNIAGRVNRFLDYDGRGYFASHFDHIFSESMGSLGFLNSQIGCSFSNSEIGFATPDGETGSYPNWCIEATGITFKNCSFRFYGKSWPVSILGDSTYENCVFEVAPFIGSYNSYLNGGGNKFLNCSTSDGPLGTITSPIIKQHNGIINWPLGKYTVVDPISDENATRDEISFDEELSYILYQTAVFAISIPPPGPFPFVRSATVNVGAGHIKIFDLNKLVVINPTGANAHVLGIVTNADPVTYIVTISYIPPQVSSGNYVLFVMHELSPVEFVGDIVSGNPTITNVDPGAWIGATLSGLVGKIVKSQLTAASNYFPYSKIIAVGIDTVTLNNNAGVTAINVIFESGTKLIRRKHPGLPYPNFLTFAGTIIEEYKARDDQAGGLIRHVAVESGYSNPVAVGKTRKLLVRTVYPFSGEAIKRITATTLVPNYNIDIYEVDTSAGDVSVNIPYSEFFVQGGNLQGQSKKIKIIKVSSDDNVVYINKNTFLTDEPISGQATITLVQQYSVAEISVSVLNFNSYTTSVTLNQ